MRQRKSKPDARNFGTHYQRVKWLSDKELSTTLEETFRSAILQSCSFLARLFHSLQLKIAIFLSRTRKRGGVFNSGADVPYRSTSDPYT